MKLLTLICCALVISSAVYLGIKIGEYNYKCPPSDYQLDVHEDSIHVWDGKRFIGSVVFDNSKLDSLILKDNE